MSKRGRRFWCFLVVGVLPTTGTGCIVLMNEVRVTAIDAASVVVTLPRADSISSARNRREAFKVQVNDGSSVLFQKGVAFDGSALVGTGLRATVDVLQLPEAFQRIPTTEIVGVIAFREETNAPLSLAMSAAASAVSIGVLALLIAEAMDDMFKGFCILCPTGMLVSLRKIGPARPRYAWPSGRIGRPPPNRRSMTGSR